MAAQEKTFNGIHNIKWNKFHEEFVILLSDVSLMPRTAAEYIVSSLKHNFNEKMHEYIQKFHSSQVSISRD